MYSQSSMYLPVDCAPVVATVPHIDMVTEENCAAYLERSASLKDIFSTDVPLELGANDVGDSVPLVWVYVLSTHPVNVPRIPKIVRSKINYHKLIIKVIRRVPSNLEIFLMTLTRRTMTIVMVQDFAQISTK